MSLPVIHGHRRTWARLTTLLDANRLPHAMLFLGPPGVGKALVAQRLAARLACTEPGAPCGACAGCVQVVAGSHPDLRSIGAPTAGGRREGRTKKEIGIDQARDLKRFVALQAIAAPRKVAIIDDADRLSIAAQNALLKTLEEPPGQALLILVTASPGALLTTVRSRCQRIAFQPLTDDEVRAALAGTGLAPTRPPPRRARRRQPRRPWPSAPSGPRRTSRRCVPCLRLWRGADMGQCSP